MSREVTGDAAGSVASGVDLEADLDGPDDGPDDAPHDGADGARRPAGPPARRAARLGLAALVGVAGLVVAALVVGRLPQTPDAAPAPPAPTATPTPLPVPEAAAALPLDVGLWAQVLPDGRESGDYTHVKAKVTLVNLGGVARRVDGVFLIGLGAASLSVPPVDPIPPQGSAQVLASIDVDCTALGDQAAPVTVKLVERDARGRSFETRANHFAADADPRDVLLPLCPTWVPGLRVAVAASGGSADGITVRVVNHGNQTGLVTPRHAPDAGDLRLVSDPPLPYDLPPGQAVVAALRVEAAPGTKGCPDAGPAAAAQALYLEAETPYGFSEVTGFPDAAVEDAVRAWLAHAHCG